MNHQWGLFFMLIVILLMVSNMEHTDQLAEHTRYCTGVEKGHWPNYKELDCE